MVLPEGNPIRDVSWEQLNETAKQIRGWVYPHRDVSQFIPWFTGGQQLALNFYIIVAVVMLIAGLALPFLTRSWWWLVLVPGSIVVWRANRKSMEQFFLQNLKENRAFYDAIRESPMGDEVKVVFTND